MKKQIGEFILNKLGANLYVRDRIDHILREEHKYPSIQKYYDQKMISRYQEQNLIWYRSNPMLIEGFYKQYRSGSDIPGSFSGYRQKDFWRFVPVDGKMCKRHFPLAASITQAMATLIFNEMPVINVTASNKVDTKRYNEIINNILDDNDIRSVFQRSSQLESYSGSVAYKIILDTDVSKYPIIEAYPAESFDLKTKYNRVLEIVFKDIYDKGKNIYMLESVYGKGYIKYHLYDITSNKMEIPITTIEETQHLSDIAIVDNDGNLIDVLLAAYKVNREVNNMFIDSGLGSSDYDGLIDIFDALDETLSYWSTYIRYGANIKTFISEDQLERTHESNIPIVPEKWGIDEIILRDNNPNGTEIKNETVIPTLSISAFKETQDNLILAALQRVGISPATLGFDMSGANSSAEALNIRENASARTRNDKITLWISFIRSLTKLLLIYDAVLASDAITSDAGNIIIQLDIDKIESLSYEVQFKEYNEKSLSEQSEELKILVDNKMMTLGDAIRQLYANIKDPSEIEAYITEIEGDNTPDPLIQENNSNILPEETDKETA